MKPTTAYTFGLTCPHCGGPIHHLADGKPSLKRTSAMCACPPCRKSYRIDVEVTEVTTGGRWGRPARDERAKYPLAPLAEALGHQLTATQREHAQHDDVLRGPSGLAEVCGVSMRTVQRWMVEGLSEECADRLAIQVAGRHPSTVWPEWWANAEMAAS